MKTKTKKILTLHYLDEFQEKECYFGTNLPREESSAFKTIPRNHQSLPYKFMAKKDQIHHYMNVHFENIMQDIDELMKLDFSED